MNLSLKMAARQAPPRIAVGAFILNSGLSKRSVEGAAADQMHGWASSTYPFLKKLRPEQFVGALSAAEITLGAALLLPVVPASLAGAGLAAFAAGTLGLYLKTPGMHEPGDLRPTEQGITVAKDVWMLGIGLGLVVDSLVEGIRSR